MEVYYPFFLFLTFFQTKKSPDRITYQGLLNLKLEEQSRRFIAMKYLSKIQNKEESITYASSSNESTRRFGD